MTLEETLKKIKPLNQEAMDAAWRRWSETSIPIHSLGKLQDAVAAIALSQQGSRKPQQE